MPALPPRLFLAPMLWVAIRCPACSMALVFPCSLLLPLHFFRLSSPLCLGALQAFWEAGSNVSSLPQRISPSPCPGYFFFLLCEPCCLWMFRRSFLSPSPS